jgi:uncharacterized membrane protein YhaH (DUF805 family)
MLGFLFGFNARIGRLQYFLASVALAIFMTMMIFAIAFSAVHGSPGLHASAREILLSQLKWPLIAVGAIFVLMSFMLQSMRFRDIGWDPVCVIPGWIALVGIDKLIATKFPALSIGHEHHGTIVGAVVNFALVMALVFLAQRQRRRCAVGIPPARNPRRRIAPPGRRFGTARTYQRGAIRSPDILRHSADGVSTVCIPFAEPMPISPSC